MKKMLAVLVASTALAYAPSAFAANFLPGDPNFQVSGDPFTGDNTVSANIGNSGLSGSGIDNFFFQIGPLGGDLIGLGSGSIITSFSLTGPTSLIFNSVTFNNGMNLFVVPISAIGAGSLAAISNVPIFSGNVNTLSVNYSATGNASYGGNLTFVPNVPGVPEPMTWALMLLGFGAVGFALRRRRDQTARVRYAF